MVSKSENYFQKVKTKGLLSRFTNLGLSLIFKWYLGFGNMQTRNKITLHLRQRLCKSFPLLWISTLDPLFPKCDYWGEDRECKGQSNSMLTWLLMWMVWCSLLGLCFSVWPRQKWTQHRIVHQTLQHLLPKVHQKQKRQKQHNWISISNKWSTTSTPIWQKPIIFCNC